MTCFRKKKIYVIYEINTGKHAYEAIHVLSDSNEAWDLRRTLQNSCYYRNFSVRSVDVKYSSVCPTTSEIMAVKAEYLKDHGVYK